MQKSLSAAAGLRVHHAQHGANADFLCENQGKLLYLKLADFYPRKGARKCLRK
jgi:hypothetical protein